MIRTLLAVVLGLFILSIGAGPSLADDRRDRHWDKRAHARPYAKPPRFHRDDWDWWHRGRWHHGFHDGRKGWWWVIGTVGYFYPAPVYPYPPPVAVVPVPVPAQPQVSIASYCREFQGDAVFTGTTRRFYGTACLLSDGAWHIVP